MFCDNCGFKIRKHLPLFRLLSLKTWDYYLHKSGKTYCFECYDKKKQEAKNGSNREISETN